MNEWSKILSLVFLLFYGSSATCRHKALPNEETIIESQDLSVLALPIDQWERYGSLLQGKNIAVVVNQTSCTKSGTHLVDLLIQMKVNIKKIFAPEHGFRGKADAGEKINDEVDTKTGLPIISLYGKKKKPGQDDLAGIDLVLYDIQDVGVRFYTYIYTLHYVMEACAEAGIPVLVLDRPNPNGHYVDGPVMKEGYTSFVGLHIGVPLVYGMTVGEYAQMINGEKWLAGNKKCSLQVIPMTHYDRYQPYDLPIKPSPNLPNSLSIALYPSLCLFEGTDVSLGRGTNRQFQQFGHPAFDKKYTYQFTPEPNEGAKTPPHQGKACFGRAWDISDLEAVRNQKQLLIAPLLETYQIAKELKLTYFLPNLFFDKLAGTDELRKQIMDGRSEAEIRASWRAGIEAFRSKRRAYLLYPE